MMNYTASQTIFLDKSKPGEKVPQLFTKVETRFIEQENRNGRRKGFWVTYFIVLDDLGNHLYSVSIHAGKKTKTWSEKKNGPANF